MVVQYGSQLRSVERLVRFSGDDCVLRDPRDHNDIALIRLSTPMIIAGQTFGYVQSLAWWSAVFHAEYFSANLLHAVGWDMKPTLLWNQQPTWQEYDVSTLGILKESSNGWPLGDQIWISQKELGTEQTILPTVNDLGSGLWITWEGKYYYIGVSAWHPIITNSFDRPSNQVARYTSLTDRDNIEFIQKNLTGSIEFDGFSSGSAFSAVVTSTLNTDYFWVGEDHKLRTRRRTSDVMNTEVDLGSPSNQSALVVEQPGITLVDSNRLWVWLKDSNDRLWGKLRVGETWQTDWFQPSLSSVATTFGISGATYENGNIYLAAISKPDFKLLLAVLDSTGNVLKDWSEFSGAPTSVRWQAKPALHVDPYKTNNMTLHVLGRDQCIYYTRLTTADQWTPLDCSVQKADGGPVDISYQANRLDMFYRTGLSGQLKRSFADNGSIGSYTPEVFDGEIDPTFPPMTVTSPFRGSYELAWRVGTKLRILRYPY
jgi:hypothetical protein